VAQPARLDRVVLARAHPYRPRAPLAFAAAAGRFSEALALTTRKYLGYVRQAGTGLRTIVLSAGEHHALDAAALEADVHRRVFAWLDGKPADARTNCMRACFAVVIANNQKPAYDTLDSETLLVVFPVKQLVVVDVEDQTRVDKKLSRARFNGITSAVEQVKASLTDFAIARAKKAAAAAAAAAAKSSGRGGGGGGGGGGSSSSSAGGSGGGVGGSSHAVGGGGKLEPTWYGHVVAREAAVASPLVLMRVYADRRMTEEDARVRAAAAEVRASRAAELAAGASYNSDDDQQRRRRRRQRQQRVVVRALERQRRKERHRLLGRQR
jgi:uncharacterized membrane protein YgcG